MNLANSSILEYLKATTRMMEGMSTRWQNLDGLHYKSLDHFVMAQGVDMGGSPQPVPDWIDCRTLKQCYRNAFLTAEDHQGVLVYCEGYAVTNFFPVMHAWVVTQDGKVIDPTWGLAGTQYFGVAVRTSFLVRCIRRSKRWGLIDNPESKWPLLRTEPNKWRHPVMDKFGAKT